MVDGYALDSFLVQLSTGAVVVWDQLLVVGVGRMTHLDRTKIAEVFASPMVGVFKFYKAVVIGNEISSPTMSRAIPLTTMTYISSVESESLGKEMH